MLSIESYWSNEHILSQNWSIKIRRFKRTLNYSIVFLESLLCLEAPDGAKQTDQPKQHFSFHFLSENKLALVIRSEM